MFQSDSEDVAANPEVIVRKNIIKKITSCRLAYCQAIINIQMLRNILSYLENVCIEISSDKKVRVTINKNKN